jgi:hypothetical protein
MIHEGNLIITSENAHNYKNLKKVGGDLGIYSEAKLDAPKLESVGGNLYIYSEAKLDAPKLESVGGDLDIYSEAKLDTPKLESVGGNLYINSEAKLDTPKLESVGGYLYIYSEAKLDTPKLESVGGNLDINSEAKLDALESVGGNLYIYSEAILNFPNNVKIKCLRNICGNIGRMKFELIDGIACVVLSERTKDNLIIRRCRRSIFKNGGLVGSVFYTASNQKSNAHGDTMKEAIEELYFKESSRDIEQYRGIPLETIKTPKQWALIYRAITGACKTGIKMFMDDKKIKRKYTLAEILEETEGAYGHDNFREVTTNE